MINVFNFYNVSLIFHLYIYLEYILKKIVIFFNFLMEIMFIIISFKIFIICRKFLDKYSSRISEKRNNL